MKLSRVMLSVGTKEWTIVVTQSWPTSCFQLPHNSVSALITLQYKFSKLLTAACS